jgi:hypothetical protein
MFVLVLVAASVCVTFFFNNLVVSIGSTRGAWAPPDLVVDRMLPIGADFHNGLYVPAQELLRTGDLYKLRLYSYPPLPAVLALPLSFLIYGQAYRIHVGLLFLAVVISMIAIVDATRRVLSRTYPSARQAVDALAVCAGAMSTFLLVSGYGFTFALERGNFDSYALMFSALAVWLMVRDPKGAALGAIVLIAIASHLKVYPLILFAVVLWRYGWRSLVPIGAVTAALGFVAGPGNALRYVDRLRDAATNGLSFWIGNHSASSLATVMERTWGIEAVATTPVLLALPLLVWLIGAVALLRTRRTAAGVVAFAALSIPVMAVLPPVSHDYKLVILYPVIAYALITAAARYVEKPAARHLIMLVSTLVLGAVISRSYAFSVDILVQNKYPAAVLLEIVVLILILTGAAKAEADTANGAPVFWPFSRRTGAPARREGDVRPAEGGR